jgi:hypothetical protein
MIKKETPLKKNVKPKRPGAGWGNKYLMKISNG